jgi:hypothetical protein
VLVLYAEPVLPETENGNVGVGDVADEYRESVRATWIAVSLLVMFRRDGCAQRGSN